MELRGKRRGALIPPQDNVVEWSVKLVCRIDKLIAAALAVRLDLLQRVIERNARRDRRSK